MKQFYTLTVCLFCLCVLNIPGRSQCFTTPTKFSAGASPSALVTGDFNRDGKLDLAVANSQFNSTSTLLLGRGDGTFAGASSTNAGGVGSYPSGIAAGDVNADGYPDLVTLSGDRYNGGLNILLGNGQGGFTLRGTVYSSGVFSTPRNLIINDFNADGKADIAITVSYSRGTSGGVQLLLGDGTGGFSQPVAFGEPDIPEGLAAGDVNADGKLDLVVTYVGSPRVGILLGTGSGTFAPISFIPSGGGQATIAIADINGDGLVDLATSNGSAGTVTVTLNTGGGNFAAPVSYRVTTDSRAETQYVQIRDINGDNKPDLVVAAVYAASLAVLVNDGQGRFNSVYTIPLNAEPGPVVVGDFNGDGRPDLATSNYSAGTVSVLLNCGTYPTAAPNTPPKPVAVTSQTATAGQPFSYTIGAFTDAETPAQLTYLATISPANSFSFNAASRVITGTPRLSGVSGVTVVATDPGGLSTSTSFSITTTPSATPLTGPTSVAVTSFSCTAIVGQLSSVSFVLGHSDSTFLPPLPDLFINGVTMQGKLGTLYSFMVTPTSPTPLPIQDQASRLTYLIWDYRAACARVLITAVEPETILVKVEGNPVHDEVVVSITGAHGRPLVLTLTSADGRPLATRQVTPVMASHREVIPLRTQSAGVLLLRIDGGTYQQTLKVLQQ